jgi:sugar-specific transcriptional regulator TrmB
VYYKNENWPHLTVFYRNTILKCVLLVIHLMQKPDILNKLGLPAQSSTIYYSLLHNGPSTIAALAKNTGLHRPLIYRHLPKLTKKSLVSETKLGKRTLYTAESPVILENLMQDLQTELAETLPGLQRKYERIGSQPVIRYFQGKHGIAYVYDRLLRSAKSGEIIYRYESPVDYTRNKKYYPPLYMERAAGPTKYIQKFVITNEKTHAKRRASLGRYSKTVPESFDRFEYDITQIIFGDKVAFIDYKTETASIIESEIFANFQRQIFKLLFNKLAG